MLGRLSNELENFSFLEEDTKLKKIRNIQSGAFRVNCLDSLDRTNVAQSMIGFIVF